MSRGPRGFQLPGAAPELVGTAGVTAAAWLLARLHGGHWLVVGLLPPHRRLVVPRTALDCSTRRSWGMVVPLAAAPFFAQEAFRPHLLPVDGDHFADAVAACVLFARDCYLADVEAAEVYLAHHHDQVEVFIPDPASRERLFRELQETGVPFDVSLWSPSWTVHDGSCGGFHLPRGETPHEHQHPSGYGSRHTPAVRLRLSRPARRTRGRAATGAAATPAGLRQSGRHPGDEMYDG